MLLSQKKAEKTRERDTIISYWQKTSERLEKYAGVQEKVDGEHYQDRVTRGKNYRQGNGGH